MQLVTFDVPRKDTVWDVKRKKWVAYRIDVRVNGKRYRDRFPSKKKAEAFIDELRDKKKRNKAGIRLDHSYSVKELLDKRLERLSGKELIRARRIFRQFLELNHDIPAQSVSKQHFQVYVNERLKSVKPSTVNREITVLSPCFKNASELFADLELNVDLARAKDRTRRTFKRTISKSDMQRIVQSILTQKLKKERFQRREARPHFARMFEVAWMLGLRFAEIRGFKPSDLNGTTLIVRRGKTKTLTEMKFVPQRAIELLQDGPFELCSEHTLTDILKEACTANGIPYGRDGIDAITFHSTRHSFTTRMSQVTDIATTAAYTGHSDKEMVAYYSHATDESQRIAMERMYGSTGFEEVFEQVKNGQMSLENFTLWAKSHQKQK